MCQYDKSCSVHIRIPKNEAEVGALVFEEIVIGNSKKRILKNQSDFALGERYLEDSDQEDVSTNQFLCRRPPSAKAPWSDCTSKFGQGQILQLLQLFLSMGKRAPT